MARRGGSVFTRDEITEMEAGGHCRHRQPEFPHRRNATRHGPLLTDAAIDEEASAQAADWYHPGDLLKAAGACPLCLAGSLAEAQGRCRPRQDQDEYTCPGSDLDLWAGEE